MYNNNNNNFKNNFISNFLLKSKRKHDLSFIIVTRKIFLEIFRSII